MMNHDRFKRLMICLLFCLLVCGAVSCGDDDPGSSPGQAPDDDAAADDDAVDDDQTDDDAADDDDTPMPCSLDEECPGEQICRNTLCRDPKYPVVDSMAYRRVTADDPDENMIVNGRLIRPAAESVQLGTFPTKMAVHPSGSVIAVNENGFGTVTDPENWENKRHLLRILDSDTLEIRQTLTMPGRSMYMGLRFSEDGNHLYVSGGQDESIHVFDSSNPDDFVYERSISTPGCYTTDIAVDSGDQSLYVSCDLQFLVIGVDLTDDQEISRTRVAMRPYMVSLSPDGSLLFIGHWSTTPRPPKGDTVAVMDTQSGQIIKKIYVGLGAEGMTQTLDGETLFVVCNKTDDVWEIDTDSLKVVRSIPLYDNKEELKGISPTMLALSEDETTLYISGAGENHVAVVDLSSGTVTGRIPTEWYPLDLGLSPDGDALFVLNGKGRGDGPTDYIGEGFPSEDRGQVGRQLFGSIFRIPVPDSGTLAEYTETVEENNTRQSRYFDFSTGNDTPLPSPGEVRESPIKHVFLILKENFSFDSAYGDYEAADGKPEYTLWDETIVPNQRKLAREFVLLDNFYCDSESSVDGHQWAVAGIEPDFMEKSWVLSYAGYGMPSSIAGISPGALPESMLFLPHVISHGFFVRAYGGFDNFGLASATKYRENIAFLYPQFITEQFKDEWRANIFIKEFKSRVAENTVPTLSYIYLPNNHAFGLGVGRLTPQSWIADNDVAVGLVVDAISKSPIWEKSLIIIFEDDAQHGFDHIDQHRSPLLAVSPWVRKGTVSSVAYSMPNIHKTVELLLGVKPMHRFDGLATGMYDLFRAKKDVTPYTYVERQYPDTVYEGPENDLTVLSSKLDWDDIDRNPEAAELYWRFIKGTEPPKRNYTLEPDEDD